MQRDITQSDKPSLLKLAHFATKNIQSTTLQNGGEQVAPEQAAMWFPRTRM